MLKAEVLKNVLTRREYSRSEKMLLCLAAEPALPRAVKEVRALAVGSGLRQAKNWNVSQILSNVGVYAVRTTQGWELTDEGWNRVAELAGTAMSRRAAKVAAGLRHQLGSVKGVDARLFVEEAVACLEQGLFRAAVVLSWVGAVSVLHGHVVSFKLAEFNAEAGRRDKRWKTAKTTDDLSRMKESEFLNVLVALSVIGKNVKQELESGLRLRNSCGHPNSLKIGEARAAAHVESLVLNVFARF